MPDASKTIIDLETRFWQSMVDDDPETAISLVTEPAVMVLPPVKVTAPVLMVMSPPLALMLLELSELLPLVAFSTVFSLPLVEPIVALVSVMLLPAVSVSVALPPTDLLILPPRATLLLLSRLRLVSVLSQAKLPPVKSPELALPTCTVGALMASIAVCVIWSVPAPPAKPMVAFAV